MRAVERVAIALVLGLPMAAFAGAGSVLDINLGSGLVGTWTGKTLGIATSFVPFLFLVSFAVEAFGKPPSEPKDFGAVVWRLLVVVVLLFSYGALFGGLYGMLDGVSKSVAPAETWDKLMTATQAFLADKSTYQMQETVAAARSGSAVDAAVAWGTGNIDAVGGLLVDAVVSLILLAGEASFRIVGTFGQVLSLLLYVLGPLAIAASLPRGSDAGMKWLRVFVAVLLWPLISALLVGLLSEYALEALKPQNSYEAAYKSLGLAGILSVTAFAVPVIASALTGAGMGAVGSGWSSMGSWAGAASGGLGAAAAVSGLQKGRGFAPSLPGPRVNGSGGSGGGAGGGGLQSAGAVGGGSLQSAGVVGGGSLQSSGVVGGLRSAGAVAGGGLHSARSVAAGVGGGGGGIGGGGGGGASPGWARGGVGSIAPAQANVSPAADAAAAGEIARGGGVEFSKQAAAPVEPPPFLWSAGGIAPAAADDSVPTMKPVPIPGPAAAPAPRGQGPGAGVHRPAPARTEAAGGRLVARPHQPPVWDGAPPQAGGLGQPPAVPPRAPDERRGGAAPARPAGEAPRHGGADEAARPTVQILPSSPKRR